MLKVLDKSLSEILEVCPSYKRTLIESITLRWLDILLALGKPSRDSYWILQDKDTLEIFEIRLHPNYHNPNRDTFIRIIGKTQDEFSSYLRRSEVAYSNIITVYVMDVYSFHPTKSNIRSRLNFTNIFNSQLNYIKYGHADSEMFLLGDFHPPIEPIDKTAWLEDNRHILNKIKEICETNKGMADILFNNYSLKT